MNMARRLPDEHEALDGATVASATAAGLLHDADLLAGAGSYGTALSLAVLGFEESVKARTLGAITAAASIGRQPGFSDDDLRKIIYSGHRERHSAGFYQHLAAAYPDVYGRMMLGMPVRPKAPPSSGNWWDSWGPPTQAGRPLQRLQSGHGNVVVAVRHHPAGLCQAPNSHRRLRCQNPSGSLRRSRGTVP